MDRLIHFGSSGILIERVFVYGGAVPGVALFGGEVLHGFSFALVIGILIGTYSSIAIAAPILVAYQDWRSSRGKPVAVIAGKSKAAPSKGRVASGQ